MLDLKEKWNQEARVFEPLQKAGFSASIAYGFKDEDTPRGLIVIEHGMVGRAGAYAGETLDWDLRASRDNWRLWLEIGFEQLQLLIDSFSDTVIQKKRINRQIPRSGNSQNVCQCQTKSIGISNNLGTANEERWFWFQDGLLHSHFKVC
mgnify:CR=1 FL=1